MREGERSGRRFNSKPTLTACRCFCLWRMNDKVCWDLEGVALGAAQEGKETNCRRLPVVFLAVEFTRLRPLWHSGRRQEAAAASSSAGWHRLQQGCQVCRSTWMQKQPLQQTSLSQSRESGQRLTEATCERQSFWTRQALVTCWDSVLCLQDHFHVQSLTLSQHSFLGNASRFKNNKLSFLTLSDKR